MIEIITLESYTQREIDLLKKLDVKFELKAYPIYTTLDFLTINGDIEYMEQRYVLKIKTDILNVTIVSPYVYFYGLKCYQVEV